MADDEMIFDPNMKKKKKKKTMPFDINSALEGNEAQPAAESAANDDEAHDAEDKDDYDKENKEKDDDMSMNDDFSGLKKKKKKPKKKPFNLDELDSALPDTNLAEGDSMDNENDEFRGEGVADDDLDFNLPSRKKKKKKEYKNRRTCCRCSINRKR